MRNIYLDFLIDASFQGVNRPFVLLFKVEGGREKDNNVMNFFDQPIKII